MPRRRNSPPMSLFSFQDIITATTGILILLALVLALSVITQGAESVVETVPQATADQLAYRAGLISEVESLRKQSQEIATEMASLSSATPAELKKKSNAAVLSIKQLKLMIENANTELQRQQQQLNDLQTEATADALQAKLIATEDQIKQTNLKLNQLQTNNRVVYNFRNTGRQPWLVQVSGTEILAAQVGASTPPKQFRSAPAFNKFSTTVPDTEQYFVLLVKPSGIGNLNGIKDFLIERGSDVGVELMGETQSALDPQKGADF